MNGMTGAEMANNALHIGSPAHQLNNNLKEMEKWGTVRSMPEINPSRILKRNAAPDEALAKLIKESTIRD